MTLIQQPGRERLLISTTEAHWFYNKYFLRAPFFIENVQKFLLLGKQEHQVNK